MSAMGGIDVVVGTFPSCSMARAAAEHIASLLHLDSDLLWTERVRVPGDRRGKKRVVLVAWVPVEERTRTRELIWRHHGRQVPLDWLSGRQEQVSPETFPP
jgi:hypothetical protein